ncbi:DUF2380 domain-containing protein [Candidatus Methylospira mobilis]|uniref:DUF2380 domain-containing protein n=1 Tax=Candidatus Methylospira mobilis TaxID=1808979 RepID=UPI0028EAC0BC|nr:DUF2380 domain-containing protein [Candidatus Methylospira mobilis]WNV05586.1 DUF2380 domain-containing protein [Candidatus Methylospira mobilis]
MSVRQHLLHCRRQIHSDSIETALSLKQHPDAKDIMSRRIPRIFRCLGIAAALLFLYTGPLHAGVGIGVLDFELKDITSNPNTPDETARAATLKPELERALQQCRYDIVPITAEQQTGAAKGAGYLYDHPDEAAVLGETIGARFIVVGRISKPSFLFVHFLARLVDVKTQKIVGDFVVELKGKHIELTGKGIQRLAQQVDEGIRRYLGLQ